MPLRGSTVIDVTGTPSGVRYERPSSNVCAAVSDVLTSAVPPV